MTSTNGAAARPHQALIAGAKTLIDKVEFDINGTHGKGGNGGLISDETIRAAGDLRIILSRISEHPAPADHVLGIAADNIDDKISSGGECQGGQTDQLEASNLSAHQVKGRAV